MQHVPSGDEIAEPPPECFKCGYNLTGLPEHRCPECGEPFDPILLRRAPCATPWEKERTFRAFWLTWWMVLVSPRKVAARFDPVRHAPSARRCSTMCYAIAIAALWLSALFTAALTAGSMGRLLPLLLILTLSMPPAMWVCASLLASVFGDRAKFTTKEQSYNVWTGLMHYASGFAILTALWAGVLAGAASSDLWPARWVFVGAAGVILLAWMRTLVLMVVERDAPGGRFVSCLFIPLVCWISITVGLMLALLGVIVVLLVLAVLGP